MKLNVGDRRSKVSSSLRAHVERGLGLALGRFGEKIERAVVRFSDLHGESCCRIAVGLRGPSIEAEGVHDDRFGAVDQAVSRVSGSIARALERERARNLSPTPLPDTLLPPVRPRPLAKKPTRKPPARISRSPRR
jgi:ribosome-associated translation inhibitor RaiA